MMFGLLHLQHVQMSLVDIVEVMEVRFGRMVMGEVVDRADSRRFDRGVGMEGPLFGDEEARLGVRRR